MDTGRTRRFKKKMELHIIILRKKRGFKAFSLTGRRGITNKKTRAIALGYELLPFTFPLRAGDRWFRALGGLQTNLSLQGLRRLQMK